MSDMKPYVAVLLVPLTEIVWAANADEAHALARIRTLNAGAVLCNERIEAVLLKIHKPGTAVTPEGQPA